MKTVILRLIKFNPYPKSIQNKIRYEYVHDYLNFCCNITRLPSKQILYSGPK